MNLGDDRNSHVVKKMSLKGPSESVCAKHQAGYTSDCPIISILLAEIASKPCKLFLPHRGRRCDKWHSAVAEAIDERNNIYDR